MTANGLVRACMVAGILSLVTLSGLPSGDDLPPDFMAQKVTRARISGLRLQILAYEMEHKGDPLPSLAELQEMTDMPPEWLRDGWNRPLYYFRSDSQHVIISFGRDGVPDLQQLSMPGGTPPERDYDDDIVSIGQEWAQYPWGT